MGDFTWHDGKGGMFPNDKGDNPERPDVRGAATVHGKPMEIAGWWREGKNGKWLSITITKPRVKGAAAEPAPGMSREDALAKYGEPDPEAAQRHGAPVQTEPDRKPLAGTKGFNDDIPF